jgi:enoyl-CoA hydratase/carnithine racemase
MAGAIRYVGGSPTGRIIVSQPLKRNAVSSSMWRDLRRATADAGADQGAALIVVVGEGDHFAAGADIGEFSEVYATPESARAYTEEMLAALDALERLSKPTLAAIRGSCVGGGCSIALACDFRYADETGRLGITPSKLGLVYSLADTRRLSAAVGVAAAKSLLFTGGLIDPAEALRLGLIDELLAATDMDQKIATFSEQLSSVSGESIAAAKKMFGRLAIAAPDSDPEAKSVLLSSFAGGDFKEGYSAFLEKRSPRFPSRRQK